MLMLTVMAGVWRLVVAQSTTPIELGQVFDADFLNRLAGVVLLVVLDWLFGVIRAIKEKQFDWRNLADFYLTTVTPYVLGWSALHVAVKLIGLLQLADAGSIVTDSISAGAYMILLLALGAQVIEKIRAVFGRVPGQSEA